MKKIAVPKIALLATTPVSVGLTTMLFTSCSNSTQHVTPAETQLTANENNIAWVEVEFDEQPKYDEAMVHVESKSGVELEIIDGKNSYESVDTVRVDDRKALVIIGVKEKQTQSINIDFDLTLSYVNQSNKAISVTLTNMKLKVDVDPTQLTDEVHVLDINDFHGAAPGYGPTSFKAAYNEPGALRVARDTHKIIEQYPGSIFLSAGDNNSGNVFSVATHGETLYPMLRAMDVQYSAVGNHAFDWGLDYLAAEKFDRWGRTATTSGKYLIASNILSTPNFKTKNWVYDPTQAGYADDYRIWKNQIVSWADPYKVLNLKGHRVCVIGLTTQKTEEDGNMDVTKHLSFINYVAAVNYAKQYCLENIGSDDYSRIESFILLTHVESDYTNPDNPTGAAIDLAKSIDTPVDAIISAHSHKEGTAKVYNELLKKDIWVGQAGKHGIKFLDTKLKFDNTKPTGSKLTDISMEIKAPYIEYGGYDPQSSQAQAAAGKEYIDLIENPSDSFNKKVVDEYMKQVQVLDEALSQEYAVSEYGQTYDLQGKNLGHEYIWFDNVLEQMGAWTNRARLYSFNNFVIKSNSDVPEAWIAFMNQDSITTNWTKGSTVRKKDMFALQTYENNEVLGYLTIGQITNILNYILCGHSKFNYSQNNVYNGRLNNDIISSAKCASVDLEDEEGLPENTSNFLCGPLQFYGIKMNIVENTKEDIDAYYQVETKEVSYEYEGKLISYLCPQIWLYDPTQLTESGTKKCQLDDSSTWIPAQYYIDLEMQTGSKFFVPTLINTFIYNGSLSSNRMFKQYFLFTASFDTSKSPQQFSQITRDLIIDFAEKWSKYVPTSGAFDCDPDEVDNMVVGETKPSY